MVGQDKIKAKGKVQRRYLRLALFFLILILVIAGTVFGFQLAYAQKFYPGVRAGYLNLGGLNQDQALVKLQEIEENIQRKGLIFRTADKEISINPVMVTVADPDLARPLLTFDWSKTIDSAFEFGRQGNWLKRFSDQFTQLIFKKQAAVNYQIDREELRNILATNFSGLETKAKNAELKINGSEIEVTPEQSGQEFFYDQVLDSLEKQIKLLNFEPIELTIVAVEPTIKKEYTGSAVNSLEKILAVEAIKLKADSVDSVIKKEDFIPWLEFQLRENEIVIGLNHDRVMEFLGLLAQKVNVGAQDAKFELTGQRVTKFQSSRDGKALDLENSYEKINQQITAGRPGEIELTVAVAPAKVATGDVNNLGIRDLIGRGVTNFAGSPVNRRYNIGVGANTLNGILIEPNEEFSLLDALGAIDDTNGYRKELVIKGDRTIPEYGGGLCQIGTTTFRVALNSGLPITRRQNHSYRVSYYEPPVGMDATIYSPSPDFRFINDTGNYILFTTHIDGDNLIFEFYGTKDGRIATTTEPVAYNRVAPGEPRYIETDTLKPGEKKKVESAHAGLETNFTYTVTYPNGEVKEQEFHSKYVAWKETWLIGRQPTTTPEVIPGEVTPTPAVTP